MEETKEPLGTEADDPATEPVTEPEGRSEVSSERTDGSPDSEEDIKFDLKPPKGLEEQAKELEKQFRSAYLKNTSAKSEKLKSLETEKETLTRELVEARQAKQIVEDLKKDPSKWEAYKQVLGINPKTQTETVPEFKDINDMVSYVQQSTLSRAQQMMDQKLNSYLQTKAMEDRWVDAWNSVSAKDSKAGLYREMVANELRNQESRYLKSYTGKNETEVIEKTLQGIRSVFQKEFDQQKQETIKSMKAKQEMTTEKASKSVPTSSGSKADRASIIAEANEQMGPPPGWNH